MNAWINAMAGFLPHYIEYDMKMPTTKHYEFSLFHTFTWVVDFYDISFDDTAEFDIRDVKVEFMPVATDVPMIKIDFPALKRWKWNAYMNSNMWWIPDGMRSTVLLEGLDIDVNAGLYHTEKGYLRPIVYNVKIEVGNSAFWHDDEWLKLFLE